MSDFLIIGGGIIGLLTARTLQKQGADVTLLEAGRAGQEASWAGGGIISPLYPWRYPDFITKLAQRSQQIYPQLAEDLFNETGIDIELQNSGFLLLDAQERIPALEWAQQYQVNMQALTESEVKTYQKNLGINTSALWLQDVMQVRNPRLLKALIKSLKQNQVNIVENERVLKLNKKSNHIESVSTKNKNYSAKKIIMTTGAWTSALWPSTVYNITPVKGQMLLFFAPETKLNKIVLHHNHYLIPRKDGHILAGSTMEYHAGFNKIPTENAFCELYQSAITLLPELKNADLIGQWAGLRPYNAEGIPEIGKVLPFDNLFINAGHFRNGLVLAPASIEHFMKFLNHQL